VVSSDKDLAQLISEGDLWWDFSRNQKLGTAQLLQKFGVLPEQMADYLALTGDAVDNIPGVPGIGPKSAAALLGHFGDLDTIYERLDEVPFLSLRGAKSIHRKLQDHRPAAELARQLTLICRDVASALASPDIARGAVDTARLNRLFDELQFGGMLRQRCLRA
jgi:5'-3' exonuclease